MEKEPKKIRWNVMASQLGEAVCLCILAIGVGMCLGLLIAQL